MTDDEILKVVKAHKHGKQIQFEFGGEWREPDNPSWDFASMEYRIKPEPHYVPYDSVDEIDRGKMVRQKIDSEELTRQIVVFDKKRKKVIPFIGGYFSWRTLKEMFDEWEYEDGTPFGKKVDE